MSVTCSRAGHALASQVLAPQSALAPLLLHALRLAEAVQRALGSSAPRNPADAKPSAGGGPAHGAAGAAARVFEGSAGRGGPQGSAWRGGPQCASVLQLDEALALAHAAALLDSRHASAALLRLVVLAAPLPQASTLHKSLLSSVLNSRYSTCEEMEVRPKLRLRAAASGGAHCTAAAGGVCMYAMQYDILYVVVHETGCKLMRGVCFVIQLSCHNGVLAAQHTFVQPGMLPFV